MLDADYLFSVADDIVELYEQLNTFGINDICRRLVNTDFQLTGSAEWQYYLLQQTGMSRAEINKKVAEITKKSEKEIKAIFEECSYRSYNADMSVYEKAGITALPFSQSERMLQILDATYRATMGELHNLTQTTANASQELLIKTLNETQWKVSTGMQSKNQAIAEAIEKVAADGIDVMYGSGAKRSIESVVRMCVTTGINQACAQISLQNCEKMGTDLVLTTSHPGARTGEGYKGHVNWQGRVFSLSGKDKKYPSFVQECGYGQIQGICGINCRHSFLPYIDGVSHNPFERYDSKNEHNKYIKQQKQRKMERDIRTTKRQLQAMQKSMNSTAEMDVKEVLQSRYDGLAYKLQEQRKNYMKFCEDNVLVPQNERMKVARFSRSEAQKAVWGAKRHGKTLDENGNSVLHPNRLENEKHKPRTYEQILESANRINRELDDIVGRPSLWNGKLKVVKSGISAAPYDGSIEIVEDSSDITILHELLHTRSYAKYGKKGYVEYSSIEEASVELLARQIALRESFPIMTNREDVDALLKVNNYVKIKEDNYEFAVALFNIELPDRTGWLMGKIGSSSISESEKEELWDLISLYDF